MLTCINMLYHNHVLICFTKCITTIANNVEPLCKHVRNLGSLFIFSMLGFCTLDLKKRSDGLCITVIQYNMLRADVSLTGINR